MYRIFRPLIFRLDPERAHALTLWLAALAGAVPPLRSLSRTVFSAPAKPVEALGLRFCNPVGLAAGYDKDAVAWRGLESLGFGHLELGTVTPLPQAGNPKPRVFRLQADTGLINRLGFPGQGADFFEAQLKRTRWTPQRKRVKPASSPVVIGINIGKNKDTPNEEAALDYLQLLERLSPYADYLTINVSSPNTVGLRRLQARDALEDLLTQLAARRETLSEQVPILVKIAPDLNEDELSDALGAIQAAGLDGVIATNTTIGRQGLGSSHAAEGGGLSGAPLSAQSAAMTARIVALTGGELPLISVGGIMTPDEARARLDAGAALVQVYTGMIYSGPGWVRQLVAAL
jgi:dihydroorotate dehydrogenase